MSSDDFGPNPYDPPEEGRRQVPKQVSTSIPQVIGILSIVFGSLIIFCGLCQTVQNLVLPKMMKPMMDQQQIVIRQQIEKERQDEIDKLKEEEEQVETEEEREAIKSQREALEQDEPFIPDMSGFLDVTAGVPMFVPYMIVDVVTSLILNIMMITGGLWLYRLQGRGRKLSIWVASIKILRLVAMNTFFLMVIVPEMSRKMGDMVQEMIQQGGGGAPPPGMADMATFYGIMFSAGAVFTILVGSIYPGIVLWLLNTQRAKDACHL